MTGSPQAGLPRVGTPALDAGTTTSPKRTKENPEPSTAGSSSAPNSVHRAASASRPSGRFAGGLRPRLDPAALTRRAPNQPRKNQKQESDQENSLTAPRSFRDDLRKRGHREHPRISPDNPKGTRNRQVGGSNPPSGSTDTH